ncbi:MAG: hypothetical protein RL264_625 [Bacteroidota bacterium]|jgi:DNA polymerase-3 subunit gamma/tau
MDDLPREQFTKDKLVVHWRQYAFKMKETHPTLFQILSKREPVQEDSETYILQVENDVLLTHVETHLLDFVDYLKKQLQNYFIQVKIEVHSIGDDKKFLSGRDKFQTLVRKYPNLNTLKSLFNLDIEY